MDEKKIPATGATASTETKSKTDEMKNAAADASLNGYKTKIEESRNKTGLVIEDKRGKTDENRKTGEDKRGSSPTTDMHNLVSDLNSFLNTTQKEIHTPKSTKKKMPLNLKKEEPLQNGFIANKFHQQDVKVEADTNKKWSCSKCTLINPGNIRICSVCGASKQFEKAETVVDQITIFDPPPEVLNQVKV